MIWIIAAMERNSRVIGRGNSIPWSLPKDLARFKQITMGHTIVMGRCTFESIGRKPLPGRRNVVISSTVRTSEGVTVMRSLSEAAALDGEIFVCGGAALYREAMSIADRMLLTYVEIPGFVKLDGDIVFPEFNAELWDVVSDEAVPPGCRNVHPMKWTEYRKNASRNGK